MTPGRRCIYTVEDGRRRRRRRRKVRREVKLTIAERILLPFLRREGWRAMVAVKAKGQSFLFIIAIRRDGGHRSRVGGGRC